MKPGYRSTEFWVSLVAVLVGALLSSGLLDAIPGTVDDQIVGIIATILSALGYTVSRSFVKGKAEQVKIAEAVKRDPLQ